MTQNMTGLKVKCPNCKRVMFETTDKYDPNVTPNGSMVRSLAPYQIDWLTTSTTGVSEMTCPECLAPLAPKGRLIVQVNTLEVPMREDTPRAVMEGDNLLVIDPKTIQVGETWPGGPKLSDLSGLSNDKASEELAQGISETIPGAPVPEFPCPECNKTFSTLGKMKGHLGGAHRKRKK